MLTLLTGGLMVYSAASMAADMTTIEDLTDGGRLESLPSETRIFKKLGDVELKLRIVKPEGWKAEDKRSAILWIHGGAWVSGDGTAFLPHCRYFASRGMVAFSIDYRLIGKPGTDASKTGPTLADCIADCRSAMRWIRGTAPSLGIDPDKIAAGGDSAGGHLAACLGTIDDFNNEGDDLKVSAMANAVIACNPITDMTGSWKSFVPEKAISGEKEVPADAVAAWNAKRERAKRLSPLFNVRKDLPPELIMQGSDDGIVQPEDSLRFAEALRAVGNRADFILFPNARHAFIVTDYSASDAEIVRALLETDKFLCSLGWLKGEPTISMGKQAEPKLLCTLKASDFTEGKIKGVTLENVKIVDDKDKGKAFQFDGKGKIVVDLESSLGDYPSYALNVKANKKEGTIIRRDHKFGGTLQFGKDKKLNLNSVRFNLIDETGIPDNAWTEVQAAVNRDKVVIKTGDKINTASNPSQQNLKGRKIIIGEGFTGCLDDIRIYNYPLKMN
jgi:acetyl esterase/lipase